ncbi:SGNH/GDSL hydrolase family protein [Mucilaginibacter sp.]|uniref:SGNH/GDSL hydrolase family protein n=1 Tax=Mucilaginibacter sp. TaxID=1882438 RepID=UPI002BD675CB|nr:SGNH/GDSL hydrolase family protein [Mucilaginibacter sp.]HTI59705.1 SGNH/GDSL hydrolase family protein [Mucilaginibacter sp.]
MMRRLCLLTVITLCMASGAKCFAADTLAYLALGDSYTVGRLVPVEDSFPYQLVAKLKGKGLAIAPPTLIAQNGWRTDELIKGIAGSGVTQKFDVVTLLIGVNNQFQGFAIDTYRVEFAQLLNTAIALAKGNKAHVFVLSIPDWGVTPFAAIRGPAKIAVQIDLYNKINREESEKAGVNYVDITDISRDVGSDPAYLAADHLHPSGKMYGLWVNRLSKQVEKRLR